MSAFLLRSTARTASSLRGSVRCFSGKTYDNIIASRPVPSVALLTLNRPKALNALSTPLFKDLNDALLEADAEEAVGAIVITGSEKAFAGEPCFVMFCKRGALTSNSVAGADIKEMKDQSCEAYYCLLLECVLKSGVHINSR